MWRIKGYRGKRTDYRQAFKIKLAGLTDHYSIINYRDRRNEMIDWCEEHCKGEWCAEVRVFWFEKRNDAIMFKLIWGGA